MAKTGIEKVFQFLEEAKTYYLATVEGDQPRVRPFGTIRIFEDKLYIQTGLSKPVGQQMLGEKKVELCAFDGQEWSRMDPTFYSSADDSDFILSYIGDGTNYNSQYAH